MTMNERCCSHTFVRSVPEVAIVQLPLLVWKYLRIHSMPFMCLAMLISWIRSPFPGTPRLTVPPHVNTHLFGKKPEALG
jgi:hypothetical protein